VEYEKSLLESEGRTGLEIVCKKCHSPICTFMDSKPAGAVESEPEKAPSVCPKCGMPLPCGIDGFDAIDVLRCPSVTHCSSVGGSCARARGRQKGLGDRRKPTGKRPTVVCDWVDTHVLHNRLVGSAKARVLRHGHPCGTASTDGDAHLINIGPPDEAMALRVLKRKRCRVRPHFSNAITSTNVTGKSRRSPNFPKRVTAANVRDWPRRLASQAARWLRPR